jgi:ubiquinone biosynthesis protein UbiJ
MSVVTKIRALVQIKLTSIGKSCKEKCTVFPSIIIHGDVKTAQLLVDLLQQVEFDFEEELSKFTGDIVAHQVGRIATKFKSSDNPLVASIYSIAHQNTHNSNKSS